MHDTAAWLKQKVPGRALFSMPDAFCVWEDLGSGTHSQNAAAWESSLGGRA